MAKLKRTKILKIRLSDDEFSSIKEKTSGAVLARYCREVLLGHEVTVKKSRAEPRPADPTLLRELNRIAVNVNQITKVLNTSEKLNIPLRESDIMKLMFTFEQISEFIEVVSNDYKTAEE